MYRTYVVYMLLHMPSEEDLLGNIGYRSRLQIIPIRGQHFIQYLRAASRSTTTTT